jgi:aryl carrier-like protein
LTLQPCYNFHFALQPTSSFVVQGFDSLRLLNLDDNCIAEWDEILKLSQLRR